MDAPASQAGEPCLLKSLRHPSVVKLLFAVKSITGQAFLVMEFMLSDLTREIQKTRARTPSGAAFRSPSLGSIRRICGTSPAEISTRRPPPSRGGPRLTRFSRRASPREPISRDLACCRCGGALECRISRVSSRGLRLPS